MTTTEINRFPLKIKNQLTALGVDEEEINVWYNMFNFKHKGTNFNTHNIYSPENFELINDFFNKSNISVVASEILIPYILLCGFTQINGVEIIEQLYDMDNSPGKLEYVRWSNSTNESAVDYKLSFLKDNVNEEKPISAKSDTANNSTILSFLKSYFVNPKYRNYTGAKLDNKWKNIVNVIRECAEKKYTNAFTCWAVGMCFVSTDAINLEELYKLFISLKSGTRTREVESKLNTIKKVVRNHPALTKNDFKLYPYSLTNIFEKIAVAALNENTAYAEEIYRIRFEQFAYTQIEMHTNRTNIFDVTVKKPKDKDKNKHIKFVAVCGNGSQKEDDIETKKHILTSGGGKGQFIGFKLL